MLDPLPSVHPNSRPTPRYAPPLCRNLRAWRLHRGLTQHALARQAGVSVATVARVEGAKYHRLPLTPLTALAQVLGCTLTDLTEAPRHG